MFHNDNGKIKMENLMEKRGERKQLINVRSSLIALQIVFIAYMLIAGWTTMNEKIRLFFYIMDLSEWEKIAAYIPLIFVLQLFFLKSPKHYYYGLVVYVVYFLLEAFTMLTLLSDKFELNIGGAYTDFNIVLKTAELILLGGIIFLTVKAIEKKELNMEE